MKNNKIKNIILTILGVFVIALLLFDQFQYIKIESEDLIKVEEVFNDNSEYIITKILCDKEILQNINKGDKLKLSIKNNEIIELNVNDVDIISLEDCHVIYQRHLIITFIVFVSFGLFIFIFIKVIGLLLKKEMGK